MKKTGAQTKTNKKRGVSLSIANVLVVIVAWGLGRVYPLPAGIIAAIYFSVVVGIAINQYNTAKARGEDTKKLKKEIQGNIVWIVIIALILGFQVWRLGGFQAKSISTNPQTPSELASQGVQQLKTKTTMPYEVDSVTTLTDVTAEGNSIQYHYIIHDADTSNVSDDALRGSVQPKVCTNTDTKNLLDHGVDMQYFYSVKETGARYSFTVSQSTC